MDKAIKQNKEFIKAGKGDLPLHQAVILFAISDSKLFQSTECDYIQLLKNITPGIQNTQLQERVKCYMHLVSITWVPNPSINGGYYWDSDGAATVVNGMTAIYTYEEVCEEITSGGDNGGSGGGGTHNSTSNLPTLRIYINDFCINSAINSVFSNTNDILIQRVISELKYNINTELIIIESPSLNGMLGNTLSTSSSYVYTPSEITIQLSPQLKNATLDLNYAVIYHELLHAQLFYRNTDHSHVLFANEYIDQIITFLQTLNPALSREVSSALAIVGVVNSSDLNATQQNALLQKYGLTMTQFNQIISGALNDTEINGNSFLRCNN